MDGLNDQSLLDVRKLITGKDGRLFVTTKKGTNLFLAEVDTFQAQLSPASWLVGSSSTSISAQRRVSWSRAGRSKASTPAVR